MEKKAVELALNTIIIAALSLMVLIILVLIFTGSLGDFAEKFLGIKIKTTGKADCLVLNDDVNDKDGDGYHDTKSYDKKYKNDDGKWETKPCPCDPDGGTGKEGTVPEHCK